MRQTILNAIKKKGWNISRLSKETEIRYPTLTEFTNGHKGLSFEHLQTVVDTLGLELTQADMMEDVMDTSGTFKRIKPNIYTNGKCFKVSKYEKGGMKDNYFTSLEDAETFGT